MQNIRTPRQQRSIEKKKRIMEAGRKLFAEKGLASTSSNEIAAAADVSIGTFYSYFKNKRTLYLEVLDSFIDTLLEIMFPAAESTLPDDPQQAIQAAITRAFRAFDYDQAFHRQTIGLRFSDPEIANIYTRSESVELKYIRELLGNISRELAVNDLDLAAKIIHGSIAYQLHSLRFLDYPLDEDVVIKELTESICRYIFI